tara:strand:- start:154 stop:258 length:105 start_codon:yes stop_codon:yes gene_type:complete
MEVELIVIFLVISSSTSLFKLPGEIPGTKENEYK